MLEDTSLECVGRFLKSRPVTRHEFSITPLSPIVCFIQTTRRAKMERADVRVFGRYRTAAVDIPCILRSVSKREGDL